MGERRADNLQGVLRQRQRATLVGRAEEERAFRSNLSLPLDDKRRRFVFAISGQGGVGKTTLLRRWQELALGADALVAWIDESHVGVPAAMGAIAEQLERQGAWFRGFLKQYRLYQERSAELAKDPDAPRGVGVLLAQGMTRGGLAALQGAPIVGGLAKMLDGDALAQQAGELAAFAERKLKNRDEVRLVREPVETLTPYFLADLKQAVGKRCVVVLMDTFERTGEWLEGWLIGLLEQRFGAVTNNLVFGLAGRDALPYVRWARFEQLLRRIELAPFTVREARDCLARHGVENQAVVEEILRVTARLPLLVSMLAATRPTAATGVGDPSSTAVECFLKWTGDATRRRAAILGAVPRRLNRDVLAAVAGVNEAEEHFDWLRGREFVREVAGGWSYHPTVRGLMLRHLRREAPEGGWEAAHERLAAYFEGRRDGLWLEELSRWADAAWRADTLEALYHRLCRRDRRNRGEALDVFFGALMSEADLARRVAEAVRQAGQDTEEEALGEIGDRLTQAARGLSDDARQTWEGALTCVIEMGSSSEIARAMALALRCALHMARADGAAALADAERALVLRPGHTFLLALRGSAHVLCGRNGAAVADLDAALAGGPEGESAAERSAQPPFRAAADLERALDRLDGDIRDGEGRGELLLMRGGARLAAGDFEAAGADLDEALSIMPDNIPASLMRGVAFVAMGGLAEALPYLNRIVGDEPDDFIALYVRGVIQAGSGDLDAAMADLSRAATLDPNTITMPAWAGSSAWLGGDDRAIELGPVELPAQVKQGMRESSANVLAVRARLHLARGNRVAAEADIVDALALDPACAIALALRGVIACMNGKVEVGLADLDRALALAPGDADMIRQRGMAYWMLGRAEESVGEAERAHAIQSDDPRQAALRGMVLVTAGDFERAAALMEDAFERGVEGMPLALVVHGCLLLRRRKRAQGEAQLRRALEWMAEHEVEAGSGEVRRRAWQTLVQVGLRSGSAEGWPESALGNEVTRGDLMLLARCAQLLASADGPPVGVRALAAKLAERAGLSLD